MTTATLTPVSAFDDAEAKVSAAARAMLAPVSATLHAQFPTAAYLVLTRPADYDDGDAVILDSVRSARGDLAEATPVGPRFRAVPRCAEGARRPVGDQRPQRTECGP